MKKNIYSFLLVSMFITGCHDLDIAPKDMVTDNEISNKQGVEAYMAGMYARLPMEDFKVSSQGNNQGYFYFNPAFSEQSITGELYTSETGGLYIHKTGYWSEGYKLIRQANELIKKLSEKTIQVDNSEELIAEAKFVRAYTMFAIVKRFGGVPIEKEPLSINADIDKIRTERSTHEECVDFILEDLDDAIKGLGTKKINGRANKYVAAAFKSRVALYGATVAKYGEKFNYKGKISGKLLCGIPKEKANEYFELAYKATKIVDEGGYSLYRGNTDKVKNFEEVFSKATESSESIFIRQYKYGVYAHCFDTFFCPGRLSSNYSNRYRVTLDWVELFDGLPKDENGKIKVVDENDNYIIYNDPDDIYKNAEPRLKASILMPLVAYKGYVMDIRRGTIKENVDPATPIKKLVPDDGWNSDSYESIDWFNENVIWSTKDFDNQIPYVTSSGVSINPSGIDGTMGWTGFWGRKWLDMDLSKEKTNLHESTQPWIDIRYAEVLLNRAEAAMELVKDGINEIDGEDLLGEAFNCINDIRDRAGANLLTSPSELSVADRGEYRRFSGNYSFVYAPYEGLHKIRVERYKELAFEQKLSWDLRRWFSFDVQIFKYKRRSLVPFVFAKGVRIDENDIPRGKYIYDTRVCESASSELSFPTSAYYENIPNVELQNNPKLEPNQFN